MAFRAIVIDHQAANHLASAAIEDIWFDEFQFPPDMMGIRRVAIDDILYLLSTNADEDSRLLVIRGGADGIFENSANRRQTFDRIIHVALSSFEPAVSVPVTWGAWHENSYLSIFSSPESVRNGERIYFSQSPAGTNHLFAYGVSEKAKTVGDVFHDDVLFQSVLENYEEALISEVPASPAVGSFGIVLSEPLGDILLGGTQLDEWVDNKLTKQQLEFVNHGYNAPVRLKGAAGTGKTVALAVKFLRDLYRFEDNAVQKSLAFLTHSSSLAHDVIQSMFQTLDPSGRWRELKYAKISLGSLYELAQEILQYERKDLQPLSTDGKDGKELQSLLIYDAITKCMSNSKFALRDLAGCSPNFQELVKNPRHRDRLIAELMNEFACVIDAEGIRKGTDEADKYVASARDEWQMPLESEADRTVVLEIHDKYCDELQLCEMLSMDQMIADFNKYLLTHEWRQLRGKNGFDAIFVDEFHYFNRAERMTFHNLFKPQAEIDGKLPVFMAHDLKQSPNDALFGEVGRETPSNIFKSVQAGGTELVELTQVFRFTPEIAAFLTDLDGSFPTLSLEEEWGALNAESSKKSGEKPRLSVFPTNTDLIDKVFQNARRDANRFGGRHVAVLCLDDRLFSDYLNAGRISGKYVAIQSRDEVKELKYAGKRCVFSMPQYVAGLQFESVYLIHVDKAALVSDDVSIGERRRFISQTYLGASRASSNLYLAASNERGGASDVLRGPLASESLELSD